MQKGQGLIFIIVGILVAGLIAGGAYYLGKSNNPKPSPIPAVTSQTPQPTLTPSPAPDETANWKTYRDNKFKVSFKYPKDFLIVTEKTGGAGTDDIFFARTEPEKKEVSDCLKELECYSYPFAVRFKSLPKPNGTSLGDIIWTDSHEKVDNFSPVKIDSLDALKQQIPGVNNSIIYHIYVDRNQTVFHIQVDTNKDLEKNVNKMLSTFKFLQ